MKNLFILFFCIITNTVIPQSFSASYSMRSTLFEDGKISNEYTKKQFEAIFTDEDKEILFDLVYKKNKFSFVQQNEGLNSDGKNKIDLSIIRAKSLGKFHTDIKKGVIQNEREDFGKNFIVEDSIKSISWVITNEEKKIGEFNCIKATYTTNVTINQDIGQTLIKQKTVTAWFCPQLSYSAGPLGYTGLPGLIIELSDDLFVYTLKRIIFNNEGKLFTPKKGKLISRKDYIKEYNTLFDAYEYENMPEELKIKKI
jgi:GLPGLI family protein